MAIVRVNGQDIELDDCERLNGIEVARRAGVEIPHYCWHPGLSVVASCRMCLVETGRLDPKTGNVAMLPKLVPACQTPAADGTVFITESEKVRHARAFVEECLLIDHPIDCPICDKAGECRLQDYHFEHGQEGRRADVRPFSSRRRSLGSTVTLFVDRCVMCSRCVRFCREVAGSGELMVVERGAHEEIDVVPGFELANKLSGNVVDLCPVGALGDKDFLYRQRVWFMKSHAATCTGCARGCSIWIDENQDHIYRLRPRENPHTNGWWMCDEGRYGFHHAHSSRRIEQAIRREGDEATALELSQVAEQLRQELEKPRRWAAIVSPHLSVEEAFLLVMLVRRADPDALLVLGPVPVDGEDETFPGGFTILSEKCPNRRGVEEILSHVAGEVIAFAEAIPRIEAGEIQAAWVSGGYKKDWMDAATADRLAGLELLVVQDLFDSPLSDRADFRLPGAAFAERDGSYVYQGDRLQSSPWAIRPPAGTWVEGWLYWRLLDRRGMYNSRVVLDEVVAKIPYFSAAAGVIPPTGIDLKLNQLAAAH